MSTYAWVDLCAVIIPFVFSFHPRLRFHARWREFIGASAGMMALFVPWDIAFTKAGVWGFRQEHTSGLYLCHLPVEEWLFFLCIPFSCLFAYHCFQVLRVNVPSGRSVGRISAVLSVGILAIALFHHHQAYTFTAGVLCAIWVAFTAFVQKAHWLGRFYFTYLLLLIPFLIVNGILTGTGPDGPVVWYDASEILGLHIFTIPVEDIIYGMLMIGLTVSLYELLCGRRLQQHSVRTN